MKSEKNNDNYKSVYVMTRIKPPLSFKHKTIETNVKNMKELVVKNDVLDYQNRKKQDRKNYCLDKVFDIDFTNRDIYHCIGIPLIERFFKGENSSFFVYGQTGSGKTHTSIGNEKEKGLIEYLLNALSKKSRFNKQYNYANISCVELYNNKFYDIFDENREIKLLENRNGQFVLKDCKNYVIKDTNNDLLMEIFKTKRKVGVSSENSASSRSHLIIQIQGKNNFISIIDMAGSEKASKAILNSNERIRENAKINESILALKECIRAYKLNQKYIPFRKNNLTKLLRNTFNDKCVCFVLSTISSDKHNVLDTINTLNYVSDMKHIHRTILQLRKSKQKPEKEDYDQDLKERQEKLIVEYYKELKYSSENREMLFKNTHMDTIFRKQLRDHVKKDLNLMENLLKIL
jgi:kinesin family protein 2/24